MKKKRLIPFRMTSASWGLSGKSFLKAEAKYYWEGEDLDRRLAEIDFGSDEKALWKRNLDLDVKYGHLSLYERDMMVAASKPDFSPRDELNIRRSHGKIDQVEYEFGLLDLDPEKPEADRLKLSLKHGRIDQYGYDLGIANLIEDEIEREVETLRVNFEHDKITKNEHDKKRATLIGEPWIGIIDQGFDPSQGVNGVYFEFDWNEFWIDFLRLNGYVGHSEEQIVEQWFADVCRATASENEPQQLASIPLPNHRRRSSYQSDNGTFYR